MRVYEEGLAAHGLVSGQVLLAPLDFMVRQQYLHARATLGRLLDLGVIPIVNENDAIADDEIRFGDNDSLAALVAQDRKSAASGKSVSVRVDLGVRRHLKTKKKPLPSTI